MIAVQLNDLELNEATSDTDPTRRLRFDFPISHLAGAASTAVAYFELDPGAHTGLHTDSAEETVVILSGRAEAIVGDERGELAAGDLGLVPALVPTTCATSATRPCASSGSSRATPSSACSTTR